MFAVIFPVIVVVYVATSLVNKDEYIIGLYYAYASVQSVIYLLYSGRCFWFVYIYACIGVLFVLLTFLGE